MYPVTLLPGYDSGSSAAVEVDGMFASRVRSAMSAKFPEVSM